MAFIDHDLGIVLPLLILLLLYTGFVVLMIRRVWRAVAANRLAELAYRERLAAHWQRIGRGDVTGT